MTTAGRLDNDFDLTTAIDVAITPWGMFMVRLTYRNIISVVANRSQ